MNGHVTEHDICCLRRMISPDLVITKAALMETLGSKVTASGFWRFFSENSPSCGAEEWNRCWCTAWGLSGEAVCAFGEDLLGNQLLVLSGRPSAFICDHENGDCHDTELSACDLVDAVRKHGVGWIDFYATGASDIAQGFLEDVDWGSHLHWAHPLVLGGSVTRENATIVERMAHLVGHRKLWQQIRGVAPGNEIHLQ